MVRAVIRVAREALKAEANENALAYLDEAIEAKRQHDGGAHMDSEMAELCAWRSRALVVVQRLEESRAELRRAFAFFVRSGDRRRALELVFCDAPWPDHSPTYCPDLVRQAFGMVEPGSLDEARLLVGYAFSMSETWEEARAMLDRARETARAHGDRALEVWIAAETAHLDTYCSQGSSTLVSEAHTASDQSGESMGIVAAISISNARFSSRFSHGRPDEAARALTELCEMIEGNPEAADYAPMSYHRRGVWHLHRGEFPEVREICREGIARGFRNIGLTGMVAAVDMHEGRLDPASEGWTTALRFVAPNVGLFVMSEALQSGRMEHVAEAERKMNEMLASPCFPRLALHGPRMVLALIACIRGDAHAAADLYPHLVPFAGAMFGFMFAMVVDRLLGLLSVCTGDLDRATKHFEDAGTFCDRAGFRLDRAWVCHDHAAALLRRNRSGDRDAAVALLERGLALAKDIGMRPLTERITGRLAEVRAAGGRSYPDGLTGREVEVLRLIARGMTNEEIGGRLFISPHTAATHVQHVLEKTGMANRAERTAYAMRQGLAE